jgi:hypothetical protein
LAVPDWVCLSDFFAIFDTWLVGYIEPHASHQNSFRESHDNSLLRGHEGFSSHEVRHFVKMNRPVIVRAQAFGWNRPSAV